MTRYALLQFRGIIVARHKYHTQRHSPGGIYDQEASSITYLLDQQIAEGCNDYHIFESAESDSRLLECNDRVFKQVDE